MRLEPDVQLQSRPGQNDAGTVGLQNRRTEGGWGCWGNEGKAAQAPQAAQLLFSPRKQGDDTVLANRCSSQPRT